MARKMQLNKNHKSSLPKHPVPKEFGAAVAWSWMGSRELRVLELTPSLKI